MTTSNICPNTPHLAFFGGLALVGLVSPIAALGFGAGRGTREFDPADRIQAEKARQGS
jgi:hypothetical protein